MLRLLAVCVVLLLCVSYVLSDVPGDLVTSLPGYPGGTLPTKHYSGFLPADAAATTFLHYWLVLSSGNPASDPLVVWMNGGPGCSSLEGHLYELGPFTFTTQLDNNSVPILKDNPNAWTTVASVLFLEQPAGVGFSYYTNGSVTSDDYIQSQNTYGFLLSFFKAYPEFAMNAFYITGESYAGIYVPTLANRIVEGNKAGNPYINLKGIAVGNGCWGSEVGTCSGSPDSSRFSLEFLYGHGIINQDLWAQVIQHCGQYFNQSDDQCGPLVQKAGALGALLDVYDVYDTCNDGLLVPLSQTTPRAPAPFWKHIGDPVVCINAVFGRLFMNHPDVRKALHLDKFTSVDWEVCYDLDYNSNLPDERPMYRTLIANMKVLIYNGDADGCVPWTGNYEWVRSMNYRETEQWRPWQVQSGENEWTGGFVTQYGANFTFLTIKHAGHMVPQYEPEAAITFFTHFLDGTPY